MNKLNLVVSIGLSVLLNAAVSAAPKELDKVVAIVDQDVVLQSEVNALIKTVKASALKSNQALPSDKALRTQSIERLILNNLQLQMAQNMGLNVSDSHLDSTLKNIASQESISVEQLRERVEASGDSYEQYREQIREEIAINEVRRGSVQRRIYVSPQEIDVLLKMMAENGQNNEEFNIGHILIELPSSPTTQQIEESKTRADKVLALLNKGRDFKEIAIASSGGAKALEGGDMGWMASNEMPSLFAEAIKSKKKSDIIGPLRSGAGFHILTIFDVRGREVVEIPEISARHILITPSVILSEEKAKQMLIDITKKINSGEAKFEDLAKEHSEDPGSALKGGELGYADPNKYVPAFRDTLQNIEQGVISEPFRSSHGWHIVEVLGKRVQDATEMAKKDKAYRIIFNRKFAEESETWMRELRDKAFVEIVED